MAGAFKGVEGALKIAGSKIAQIDSWEITVSADTNETTAFGNKDKNYVHGLRNATATVSGRLDDGITGTTPNAILDQMSNTGTLAAIVADLVISTEAAHKAHWVGSALVSSVSVGSQVAGTVSFTASLQFNNGAKYTTTTAT